MCGPNLIRACVQIALRDHEAGVSGDLLGGKDVRSRDLRQGIMAQAVQGPTGDARKVSVVAELRAVRCYAQRQTCPADEQQGTVAAGPNPQVHIHGLLPILADGDGARAVCLGPAKRDLHPVAVVVFEPERKHLADASGRFHKSREDGVVPAGEKGAGLCRHAAGGTVAGRGPFGWHRFEQCGNLLVRRALDERLWGLRKRCSP